MTSAANILPEPADTPEVLRAVASDVVSGAEAEQEAVGFDAGLAPDDFKAAFRNHPAGVAVVTADDGTGPVAMTVTSVFSVSADPALLVFSVSDLSSSAKTIIAADTLVVHLLGADQLDIAQLGATSGIDRFADTSLWSRLITGEPFYPSAQTWIRGRVVNSLRAGASTVVVVHALQANAPEPGSPEAEAHETRPLVYHNRTWHKLDAQSELPPTAKK
ncbi:flavin reductase family protein [Mycetocola spongiae]|uniref:flavin reductase family protein n=1 Tax=Mycetocola spongiae TaxID=2859226 RepID=UPI001CF31034|nr:flavin reductase family protein [Mycetocola spongiae]UCR88916.1 flavin reductase family protein [Mycetocola spongiae]